MVPSNSPPQPDDTGLRAGLWKDRRVLVTGGLGFIGSTLARRIAGYGAKVTVVDSLVPEYGGNIFNLEDAPGSIAINISDIRDAHSMRWLVRGQEMIFNLAGQTSHMDSMQQPFTDLEINCTSQLSLLEICRNHCPEARIVFASTRQIYGRPRYLPVDEQHPIKPVDVNGINKLAGESYHTLYNEIHGLWTAVLRLTNVYGPRMRVKDARQTFLGIWIKTAVEGRPFEVWGGEQLRDYCYVDDAVDALLDIATTDAAAGKPFNLGGDGPLSLLETARLLSSLTETGFEIRTFPEDRKRIDIGDYYADDRLFRNMTGWRPRISLAEGLRRTVDHYRQHLTHYL